MDDPDQHRPAFRVGAALANGIPRRTVDGARFERPFHGLRALTLSVGDEEDHPAERRRADATRLARQFATYLADGEVFSHETAAILWQIPLPMLVDATLHVSVMAPRRAPRGSGVSGHQLAARLTDTTVHPTLALAVTTPATTWALLGTVLRHPYDLVAAADAIVRIPRMPGPRSRPLAAPLATVAELRHCLEGGRRRGVVALREALPRVRQGSSSRPETWMRLTLVDAGLPEPVCDHDVYDDEGDFVGCVDQAYPRLRVALEYEGDQHRTEVKQWNRDIQKHDRLTELGWRVIRVTRAMLFESPEALTSRVRTALRSRS